MEFTMLDKSRYASSKHRELVRISKGEITFEVLLNGVLRDELLPFVKPCNHGNTPSISALDNKVRLYISCCNIDEIIPGTKARATLFWNSSAFVDFGDDDILHPVLNIKINDSLNAITQNIKTFEDKLQLIEKTERSREEGKLINLLRCWNQFSVDVKNLKLSIEAGEVDEFDPEVGIESEVPLVLVRTWLDLQGIGDPVVINRAKKMLRLKVGSEQQIQAYKNKHGLK